MFNGKIHYKLSFSIAMLNYQSVYYVYSQPEVGIRDTKQSDGWRFPWNLKYPCPFLSHLEGKQGNKKHSQLSIQRRIGWNQQSAPQLAIPQITYGAYDLSGRKFGHEEPVFASGVIDVFLVGDSTVSHPSHAAPCCTMLPPARQPHGDLDRRQFDQYLGTHGARHWVYNVYNVPCLTKFSTIFCSKYAANIPKWSKIYENDKTKTKTSFPFEKGPSLKKKNMSFKQNGWKTATSATKPFLV